MPNMSGFEFLSVVRKRFPRIAVIAISGEFSGIDVPESVLQTPFFEKGQYSPEGLFQKITALLEEIRSTPKRRPSAQSSRLGSGQRRCGLHRGDVFRLFENLSGSGPAA